jgi:hypothetical protein
MSILQIIAVLALRLQLGRKDPADGIEYFEGKPDSVFDTAAVVVFALVGPRPARRARGNNRGAAV